MKVSEVGFVFSAHHRQDNIRREAAIRSIGGDGENIIAKFYWDRGHNEGAEWHWITDNAIIIATNVDKEDGKLVCSKLIARPEQLQRYTRMGFKNELNDKTKRMRNWLVPTRLIALAQKRQREGLNYT